MSSKDIKFINVTMPDQMFQFVIGETITGVNQHFPNDHVLSFVVDIAFGDYMMSQLRDQGWFESDDPEFA